MRSVLRRVLVAAATGALTVSVAWAGAGLAPAPSELPTETVPDRAGDATAAADATADGPVPTHVATPEGPGGGVSAVELGPGEILAGASRVSIQPRPDDYDGTWVTDHQQCATLSEGTFSELAENPEHGAHLATATSSPWPENPDCIYMGGFGIGPMNPVTSWNEELGLWVRSLALRDVGGDTLVLTVLDGEGYFWDYASKCDDCGIKQISQRVGTELGIDPAGIVIASTHAHSAPDFIGGWGFVPDWYMEQVGDAIEQSIVEAVGSLRRAQLEAGEELARPHNRERRDTYRSAEEQQIAWLRAVALNPGGEPLRDTQGRPEVIATVGAYAAHPTAFGTNEGQAHPDWPGVFEHALEDRFGGVGMHLMTGLGNMSAVDGEGAMPTTLAGLIPAPGAATTVDDTDIRTARHTWNQPVTNAPLSALGLPGFFDRQFDPTPAAVTVGGENGTACQSSSPTSVEVAVNAARIGDALAVSSAPGEIFANLSNTLKEQSGAAVTMPLGQANDALGYMPQSFELHEVGQQGAGFVGELQGYLVINYEDAYAIDRCFGDMALENTIQLFRELDG